MKPIMDNRASQMTFRKTLSLPVLLLLIFSASLANAQNQKHKMDSMLAVIKVEKDDTNKVKSLDVFSFSMHTVNPDSTILMGNQAAELAKKLGWKMGEAWAYDNIGVGYSIKSDNKTSLKYFQKSLDLQDTAINTTLLANTLANFGISYENLGDFKKATAYFKTALEKNHVLGNKSEESNNYCNLGSVYYYQSDFSASLDNFLQSLSIAEEIKDSYLQETILSDIANVYVELEEYDKALDYYNKALNVPGEEGDKRGQTITLGNIGSVYQQQGDNTKAQDYFIRSLKIARELGDQEGIASGMCNLGVIYGQEGNYDTAFAYLQQAENMAHAMGNKYGEGTILGALADLYVKKAKYKDAETTLDLAIQIDSIIGESSELRKAESLLAKVYNNTGRYKDAITWFMRASVLKDSLFNEDKDKAITRRELTYQFDKKEALQKADQDKKDALNKAEVKRQRIVIYAVSFGLLLVVLLAISIFNSLRQNRKKTMIIEEQRKEVIKKNAMIEEKNKDIVDSITYAKRLQDAILPPVELIQKHFPDSFLLYKPKAIVAGDFYWMEAIPTQSLPSSGEGKSSFSPPVGRMQEGMILLAACDCTGHGVPGAMVSVVCSNALNRAVKEFGITEPGKILDKTRELVLETFSKRDAFGQKSEGTIQDGMDASLLSITHSPIQPHLNPPHQGGLNKNTDTSPNGGGKEGAAVRLQWSGAYNSLWYIRDGKMNEIRGDKQPVGKIDKLVPFTTHTLELQKGDALYLFTDGFADQFGGPKGKKIKHYQFQQLIAENCKLPMKEQQEKLDRTFEEWKGNMEQTDDVCVIGIRI